jgi:catechol 2,3-dioxygenase-like lactoylglutathione lyase family enzyme
METIASQVSPTRQPRFSGMSHVSLPCRELEDSKIFYAQVMGGELVHEIPGFVEYRIEDIIVGLSEQIAGWTDPEAEYPHYAFYLSGPNFDLMKTLARSPWRTELSLQARPDCVDVFPRSVRQSLRALL